MLSAHIGDTPSTENSYIFCSLVFPVVSFNAPEDIVILMSPPGKLFIVNGNVFVLLSELVVTEPNDKLFNVLVFPFLSVAVIDTFDELNVVDANALLSVPLNCNVYFFASASYVPFIILSAHTGLSPSIVNSYIF